MQYIIWQVSPYSHSQAFDEIAETLQAAFSELHLNSHITKKQPEQIPDTKIIILGAHLLTDIPPGAIIYNLEQLGSQWFTPKYMQFINTHETWDYCDQGLSSKILPIGYHPVLEKITPQEENIDVLFYGSSNQRRTDVLKQLQDAGLKVIHAFDCYGSKRDELISRSKIILNIHYYEAKVFEIVRCSYLLANQKCIVSETGNNKNLESQFYEGIRFVPYGELVQSCIYLIKHPLLREDIARKGYDVFRTMNQANFLRSVL